MAGPTNQLSVVKPEYNYIKKTHYGILRLLSSYINSSGD